MQLILLIGGLAVVGLLLYIAFKPSSVVSLPAGGGGGVSTSSQDPGWAFANNLTQSISSTVGGIVQAVRGGQPTHS